MFDSSNYIFFSNRTSPIPLATYFSPILHLRFHYLHFFLQSYVFDSSNYNFFFNRTSPIPLATYFSSILHLRFHYLQCFLQSKTSDSSNYFCFSSRTCPFLAYKNYLTKKTVLFCPFKKVSSMLLLLQ